MQRKSQNDESTTNGGRGSFCVVAFPLSSASHTKTSAHQLRHRSSKATTRATREDNTRLWCGGLPCTALVDIINPARVAAATSEGGRDRQEKVGHLIKKTQWEAVEMPRTLMKGRRRRRRRRLQCHHPGRRRACPRSRTPCMRRRCLSRT